MTRSNPMERKIKNIKKSRMETKSRKKRTVTPIRIGAKSSEIKSACGSIVPQNKYVEAALKHQGSFIVYDPKFML